MIRQKYLDRRDRAQFGLQLATSLDLLSGALRAGQSLTQALALAAAEAPRPAAGYFAGIVRETALGTPVEDAVDRLASAFHRADCGADLRMFDSSIAITRTSGGNLAEILSGLAVTVRERERLRAEVAALTAQGRMSGWIVGLLPVAILVSLQILDPGLMAPMFHSALGWTLLGIGMVLELLGVLMIRQIVRVDA